MPLNHRSLPLIEYHKAKRLMWDPRDVDLALDAGQWPDLTDRERDLILRGCAVFLGGEAAVTHDLAPLLVAVRREGGHLEEEMFLTVQLFEEAKHVEWFERWLNDVAPDAALPSPATDSYRALFEEALPQTLGRLLADSSRGAQLQASTVYHLLIEGVLAETGYRGFARALKGRDLLPGLITGIELVQRDEARHISFGIYFIRRLLLAEPALRPQLDDTLNRLLPHVLGIVGDVLAPYGDDVPFGLSATELIEYAGEQFAKRMSAVERPSMQPERATGV